MYWVKNGNVEDIPGTSSGDAGSSINIAAKVAVISNTIQFHYSLSQRLPYNVISHTYPATTVYRPVLAARSVEVCMAHHTIGIVVQYRQIAVQHYTVVL